MYITFSLHVIMGIIILYYKNLSEKDGATQAYNKHWFMGKKSSKLVRMMRAKKIFGLIVLDMDNFKKVNDEKGHMYGDKLISDTFKCIKASISEQDILARIGGDEIAVIVTDVYSTGELNHICNIIENSVYLSTGHTVSAGGALYNSLLPVSVKNIMNRADKEMYKRKKSKLEDKEL